MSWISQKKQQKKSEAAEYKNIKIKKVPYCIAHMLQTSVYMHAVELAQAQTVPVESVALLPAYVRKKMH